MGRATAAIRRPERDPRRGVHRLCHRDPPGVQPRPPSATAPRAADVAEAPTIASSCSTRPERYDAAVLEQLNDADRPHSDDDAMDDQSLMRAPCSSTTSKPNGPSDYLKAWAATREVPQWRRRPLHGRALLRRHPRDHHRRRYTAPSTRDEPIAQVIAQPGRLDALASLTDPGWSCRDRPYRRRLRSTSGAKSAEAVTPLRKERRRQHREAQDPWLNPDPRRRRQGRPPSPRDLHADGDDTPT